MLKGERAQVIMASALAVVLLGGAVVTAAAQGGLLDTLTGKYYKGKVTSASGEQTVNLFVSKQKDNQIKIGSNNPGVLADACINVAVEGTKVVAKGDPIFVANGCGIRGGGRSGAPTAGLKLTIDSSVSPATMSYTPAEGTTFNGALVPMN
jgi:hypothetical protein